MCGMPMVRQLYILRHAKSSWDDPGQDDHERPLAPRGRRAVTMLADHIRRTEIHPELVLCSTSRRTRETLEGVNPVGEPLIERGLYTASCEELIERLRRLPATASSAMVVGHNPTMQMVVLKLVRAAAPGAPLTALEDIRRKYPTGALATLAFTCAWAELGCGATELVDYVRPKALLYQ
jgi:phosphohistidine phosphatase